MKEEEEEEEGVLVSRPRKVAPPRSATNEPWVHPDLAKTVRLPDKNSGKTTILSFDISSAVSHKGCDGYGKRVYDQDQTWPCGWSVNQSTGVVVWPAETEKRSFATSDGTVVTGKWTVSKVESGASEIPVDVKSGGFFTMISDRTGVHYRWGLNTGSEVGRSSERG